MPVFVTVVSISPLKNKLGKHVILFMEKDENEDKDLEKFLPKWFMDIKDMIRERHSTALTNEFKERKKW